MPAATAEAKASNATENPHVTRTPGVCGGKPCVAGTRVRVWDIYDWYSSGHSVDEIIDQFPHLTRAGIHGAMAYFWDHEDELKVMRTADREYVERMRKAQGPTKMDAYRHLLK